MPQTQSWSDLIRRHSDTVPSHRALRPSSSDILQYSVDEREYLAVHGTNPYGALAKPSENTDPSWGILELDEAGGDYTVFHVTEETLALSGLTLGTGARNAELLRALYGRIGQVLARIATTYDGQIQHLGVEDFAYDRRADKLILLPPIGVSDQTLDANCYSGHFVHTMHEAFGHYWSPDTLSSMSEEVVGSL